MLFGLGLGLFCLISPLHVCPAVQRQMLTPQEKILEKLQEIRKVGRNQHNSRRRLV